MRKIQFCKRGHDTFVTGRDKTNRCKPCRIVEWKETYVPKPKPFVQFCPKGHDKLLVGKTLDNHCCECRRLWKKEYYILNRAEILEQKKQYGKDHPEIVRLCTLRNQTNRNLRIPKFGQEGIVEFYKNCPVGMVIDHIIPLQGKMVSGLHVLWNLQYLTVRENQQKRNKVIY